MACGGGRAHERDLDHEPPAAEPAPEGRLWVLAPHPDDEILIAAEQLRDAVARGRPVSVVVMTNGDLSCSRNGHLRQRETVSALATLGVHEDDVHFLGYPDGWLDALGPTPLAPLPRFAIDGTCGVGDATYAEHGEGGTDVHSLRTGAPGPYVATGPVEDLAYLLARDRPSDVVTTHPIDTHPDHARTYVFLRQALERASIPPPRVLRAMVHQGPCWPNGAGDEPCPSVIDTRGTAYPPFAPPLDRYRPPLRWPSPDEGFAKRHAIAEFSSQLGTPNADESWLSSFARTDEVYWPERLVHDAEGHLDRPPVADGQVGEGVITRPGELTVSYLAPFVLRASARIDGPTGLVQIALLDDDEGETLILRLDSDGVTLRRGEATLLRLPVPHGEELGLEHVYSVRVDPRPDEGPVAEVTVRRDGMPWGFALVTSASGRFAGDHVRWTVERGALQTPAMTALHPQVGE